MLEVDPTTTNFQGLDALHLALKHGHFPVASYLIGSKQFNLGRINSQTGFNYFGYAVIQGSFQAAKVMLA